MNTKLFSIISKNGLDEYYFSLLDFLFDFNRYNKNNIAKIECINYNMTDDEVYDLWVYYNGLKTKIKNISCINRNNITSIVETKNFSYDTLISFLMYHNMCTEAEVRIVEMILGIIKKDIRELYTKEELENVLECEINIESSYYPYR